MLLPGAAALFSESTSVFTLQGYYRELLSQVGFGGFLFFVCIFFRFSSALYIVFDYSKLLLLLFVLFLQVSLLHVSNFKI